MYSVIKNVYGSFHIHASGMTKAEAISECTQVIGESHGGEAYAVTDTTAKKMEHEICSNRESFNAFGINGQEYAV